VCQPTASFDFLGKVLYWITAIFAALMLVVVGVGSMNCLLISELYCAQTRLFRYAVAAVAVGVWLIGAICR
jgi:hypothetical protein